MLNSELVLNIGPIIRAVRKFFNLQQWELANTLGITQGNLSKIENQLHAPDLIIWYRFLDSFNVRDSKCFLNNSIEIDESFFLALRSNGSYLAPNFDFKDGNYLCRVQDLNSIWDDLKINDPDILIKFFKKFKVHEEILLISNHPLTTKFIIELAAFQKEKAITREILNLVPDFYRKENVLKTYS